MSAYEYNDLFLKCQETGKYHVFTFDIEGCKNIDSKTRYDNQDKMVKLMKCIYTAIQDIEKKTNKKILVFEDDFVSFDSGFPTKGYGMKQEPFKIGDMFGFTIYRDSLDKEVILSIYEYFKKSLGIEFNFHIADGYYETNDYLEGRTKYFRAYCIDLLSNLHKPYNNGIRKKLEKQKLK